jgi:DNA-binding transcriptional ArsR family regulator
MLKNLFQSKTREDILVLLLSNPKKRLYIREISRLIDQEPNAVSGELKNLESAKIVISEKEGKVIFYKANEDNPIFAELRSIIFKTAGIGGYLRTEIQSKSILFAFIYGSTAGGEDKKGSDIDLMIIGTPDMEKIAIQLSKAENKLNREINYSVFSPQEFLLKKETGFLQNVIKNKKLMIIGDDNGFKRFVESGKNPED